MMEPDIGTWEGSSERSAGSISELQAAQLHATLGDPRARAPGHGDPLPPLWHWCAFPPLAPMSELGRDGHPEAGALIPATRLNRRMWAGGALRFIAPIRVGDRLERRSVLRSARHKTGASGPMMLVSIDHAIYGPRGLAIEERQDIVYLNIPDGYSPPKKLPLPTEPVLHDVVPMSETLLFRYSALTFNAHRIHYDLEYARNVEHYPGLVVHGPLQAQLLVQAATQHRGRPPEHFDYRGVHPMFHEQALDVVATEGEDGELLMFTGQDGHQGMQAAAMWEGTV